MLPHYFQHSIIHLFLLTILLLYTLDYPGFSSSHVRIWELDCKESRVLKNWCFWTVVLEKTLESPLDCREIQPVHSKGDQAWVFFGRNDAKAETLVLWPPQVKSWLIGKVSGERERWRRNRTGRPLSPSAPIPPSIRVFSNESTLCMRWPKY